MGLVGLGLVRGVVGRGGDRAWVTREAVMRLVEEAAWTAPARGMPVWRRAEAKAVWVMDLFAALEARERASIKGYQ